jgi:hypothetical protein
MACAATVAGCVGDLTPTPGSSTPDAHLPTSSAPGTDARLPPADASTVDAAPFRCRNQITAGLDNGHHNAGQNCQDSCHNHGFYLSGTLYSSASGGAPVVGASITFRDATGYTGDMVSGTNGNFWWTLPVTFPVTLIASSCPDMQPMTTMLATAADGGCNKGGCHASGSANGRAHLP